MSISEVSGGVKRAKLAYTLALTISSCGWGVFYTFSTRYITAELGGGTLSMYLFTGASWLFSLSSLLAKPAVRLLGERSAILLGVIAGLPAVLGLRIRDPLVLALVLSASNIPWAISWPIVLKVVFSRTKSGLGAEYSGFTLLAGVGYIAGSLVAGLLYATGGLELVYVTASLLIATPFIAYYAYYTPTRWGNEEASKASTFRVLKWTLIAICLFVLGRELFFSQGPGKINYEIEQLVPGRSDWVYYMLYGLVYSGGALISPLARFLAGRIVDKYGPRSLLVASICSYTLLYWSFTKTSGVIPLVLWQIPLFPLYDVAVNTHIARLLPRQLHVHGFALLTAFTALGGSLVTLLLFLRVIDLVTVGYIVTSTSLVSIALILYEKIAAKPRGLI